MKISCLVPTYGRPTLVQNAIACFLAQDYPADRRRLLILDDAGQITPQSGEGWCVWSTPHRMETLAAKYVKLDSLDAGWAEALVIWDDDDIYLPWHLSGHAAALRDSRWSYPEKIWTLKDGRLELCLTDGRFWASAAVRVDLLRSLNGFVQSAAADFDQANLRAWRQHGGVPGRPSPPSVVYGWGRSNHCSSLMVNPNATEWYKATAMMETAKVDRLTPNMDTQTAAIFAALAPSPDTSMCSTAGESSEAHADAYDVVRALLGARELDDHDTASSEGRRILLSFRGAERPELWAKLAEEAEYHGIAPLLEPMISALARAMPQAIPDDVRRTFVALASRHRGAAVAREKCVDQLLTAFAAAGIPIILLKGAALAHLIYPAPELRPMVDIDVLIDRADVDPAIHTVCALGYCFAPYHASRFAGRMHHLPPASMTMSGFRILLEVHLDAMSPNLPERLKFAKLSAKPRPFQRGSGPRGLALGHTDMLRHLVRHAFEPARHVRLKHLYDLQRYQAAFTNEIDWDELKRHFPQVIIALRLASFVFAAPRSADSEGTAGEEAPAGVGMGMVQLSEIANMPFAAKLAALFNPSAWWLHGFYAVPLDRSLLVCRTIRHPLTLVRWFAKRITAAIVPRRPFNLKKARR
jgi:hypothetical protein